ncbi:MAG: hypothetical protein HGA22_10110, partial [Clostridiales bacterium]|nr:hypothetical protein [Clostridiales bacterium]
MSLDLLKDDIKNNRIRKLYLFHGPEQYLSKHYLGVVEKALIAEDLKVLNRVMLEGKADQGVIINNCETMPVFSEKRIVIVKNSGLFKASKKQAAALDNTAGNEETTASEGETTGKAIETGSRKKAGAEKKTDDSFPEYLAGLPEHVCLIFLENEIDKRLKIVDAIKKAGLVVEFAFQKPDELERWITRIFKASGKEISSDTAAVMINGCEPGMTEIMNEIEKLKSFIGEKTTVSISDIEKVCTKSIKGRVFDITDAIAVKNCTRALKLQDDHIIQK